MNYLKKHLKRLTVITSATLLLACVNSGHESNSMLGKCPQPRFTEQAPDDIYTLNNPLENSAAVISAGEELYMKTSARTACKKCHGSNGDGLGQMASLFEPPPRNFRCSKTISDIADGQLFWIIKNGSPGTSMPAFDHLSDLQIWQLVHYIRAL